MPATERIGIRVNREEKKKISAHAKRLNMSYSAFVLTAVRFYMGQEHSERDEQEQQEIITLTPSEFKKLKALLSDPPKPNSKLKKAVRSYRELSHDH